MTYEINIQPVILKMLSQSIPIFLTAISFLNFGCKRQTETVTAMKQNTVFKNYTYVEEYNSGNNSELVDLIQVSAMNNWDRGEVVYSIQLSQLKQGDLIECLVDMEVTNDVLPDQVVYVVSQIILTDSPVKLPGDLNTFEIGGDNGYGVTPDMHHGHIVISGKYVCKSDHNINMYVNLCMYAQSNTAGSNDWLIVNQDYGRLSPVVFKNIIND